MALSAEPGEVHLTSSLDELQTEERRIILSTISEVRGCGLEGILSLPQIVVCGDQSAGKSSVLEALAEIPFPRNDNLCTRFATEVSLRREAVPRITVKIIPDGARSPKELQAMTDFRESITDFSDLPRITQAATELMGISETDDGNSAFAKDTLSIEIGGPDRQDLTLVDIPGLIQTSTRGVSDADVSMSAEITDHYISQHRTICLAIVSAAYDAANQPILQRVRKFDPEGKRTLGVITKPDGLPEGSGSEDKFLELARNEDVVLELGWHVIKNRNHEESDYSLVERNTSEEKFFSKSNFKSLPKETVGIRALRQRLGLLLFNHAKTELPRLKEELEKSLQSSKAELDLLGPSRVTPTERRVYLVQLATDFYEICRAGLHGNYDHDYFMAVLRETPPEAQTTRLRARIQAINNSFSNNFRRNGHKYTFTHKGAEASQVESVDRPKPLDRVAALAWVKEGLSRSRGKELMGNFNPLLVGELFWEQSEGWKKMSEEYVYRASKACKEFFTTLLQDKATVEVGAKIRSAFIDGALEKRRRAAFQELDKLIEDSKDFPINYNHYYADTIHKKRQGKMKALLEAAFPAKNSSVYIHDVVSKISQRSHPDMEEFVCEEVLDCLMAIYKVQYKTFVANVVTQVTERHIVRGLDKIFYHVTVLLMTDAEVERIAAEPTASRQKRMYLNDRISKFCEGREIFRNAMDSLET